MPKIFGREPATWLGLVAVVVQFVSAFVVTVSPDTQTTINAAAAAALGLVTAVIVKDGVIAAVTGFAQAGLALAMGLGLDWSTGRQAAVMALVTVVAQAFVRSQVTAPVTAAALARSWRKPTAPAAGA